MFKTIRDIFSGIRGNRESSHKKRIWKSDLEEYIACNYIDDSQQEEEETGDFVGGLLGLEDEEDISDEFAPLCADDEDDISFDEWEDLVVEKKISYVQVKSIPRVDTSEYEKFLVENNRALQERMNHISDSFQEYLFYLIERRKMSNADVYKRALITKQLFSKIKRNPEYHPDKSTAMRLCIGAKLNLDETKDLLARAGYALSPCDKRDIIFSFFIEHSIFDMIEIDIALEEYGLPCFIE